MEKFMQKLVRKLQWIQYWKAGLESGLKGDSFSMNPYPALKSTDYSIDNLRKYRALWSKGYWCGVKLGKK